MVFSCAAMLGFLLTALVPFRLESWWFWPLFRVLWQGGGGLWCGLGIALLVDAGRAKWTLGCGLFGLLLAVNPLLDLVRGPVQGELLSMGTTRYPTWAGRGPGAGVTQRGQSIQGTLLLRTSDGEERRIEPMGAQANRMESLAQQGRCESHGGQVVALQHLDIVLELDCTIVGVTW